MDSAVPVSRDPVAGQAQTSSLSSGPHGRSLRDGECERGRCLLWGDRGWADSQVPWRWGRCRPKCTGLCRAVGQAHLQRWAGRSKAGNTGTGHRAEAGGQNLPDQGRGPCLPLWLQFAARQAQARVWEGRGGGAGQGRLPRRRWPRECNYEV